MVKIFSVLYCLCCCIALSGQVYSESMLIEVCANKTTSLVFPFAIIAADRGSEQILVQKSASNILKVKAAGESSGETNLTVVTSDNLIYSFIARYAVNPKHLTIFLGKDLSAKVVNKLASPCQKLLRLKNNLLGAKFASGKVSLRIPGWYVQEQYLFCKMKIENRSEIGYDIEQLRFYIRDNNAIRRTASQELVLQPVFVYGDTTSIRGKSSRIWVVVLNKFTIPDDKHFEVEMLERNGGRNLYLKIFNRQLMLAKPF